MGNDSGGVSMLPFVKMEGAGNDYVYIDDIRQPLPVDEGALSSLAVRISDIHYGIGSDGLILITTSEMADFRMRMFNADGSEAQMCGNGIRCVGKYLHDLGITRRTKLSIETGAGIKHLELHLNPQGEVGSVTVDMGAPILEAYRIPVKSPQKEKPEGLAVRIGDTHYTVYPIGMGNPHGVIFLDEITDREVLSHGPQLETADIWPEKANIEFITIKDRGKLEMRVWERGSGETWACGTGACAAAVAASLLGMAADEVEIKLKGGRLKIRYDREAERVYLTGGASFIAKGYYFLHDKS